MFNLKEKKRKLTRIILFGTLLSAFIMLLVFFFWILYPYKPLIINKVPMVVEHKTIEKGDFLVYESDYCKTDNIPVKVNMKFSDGIEFPLPEYTVNNSAGCRTQNIIVAIPETLPAGDYILVVNYTYQVNPVRSVTVKAHTQKFSVIK